MHVMIEFGRKIYQECLKEIKNAKENCLMYNSIIDFIENDTTKIKKF